MVRIAVFLAGLIVVGGAQAAGPYDGITQSGVAWLVGHQNLDGSWGASDDVKYVQTSEAVLAMAALNELSSAYYAGLAWLGNHAPANVDFTARRVLALGAANQSISHDLQVLQEAQSLAAPGNNGWGLSAAYQGSALDTGLTLQALVQQDVSTNVSQAVSYLTATQLGGPDSGWALGQETASDPATTAQALIALVPLKSVNSAVPTAIANGLQALNAKVTISSPATQIALAILANLRNDPNTTQAANLLSALASQQSTQDASWNADPYATALALRAFSAAAGKDQTTQKQIVNVPDNALRKVINIALGHGALDAISAGQLQKLTSLYAQSKGISDLTGLQFAANLTDVDLRNNKLTSLTQVSFLSFVPHLLLTGNLWGQPTGDTDGDGVSDANEIAVSTNPFSALYKPWLKNTPLIDLAGLAASTPEIAMQSAWNALPEDFDGDSRLDLVLYFNGSNENVVPLDSGNDSSYYSYMGPSFGVLVYLENVGGSYVRRTFSNGDDIINGDIEQMIPLDYNNDGKRDLLLVMDESTTGNYSSGYTTSKPYRRLVLMKNDSGSAYISTNNPNGTHFSDVTTAVGLDTLASWATPGTVVDLNHDGYPDLIDTMFNGTSWVGSALLYDKVSGTYKQITTPGLPSLTASHSMVDLDGDGQLDLVTYDGTKGLRFFRNNGDLSFTEWPNNSDLSQLAGHDVEKIIPADMNNDGRQDFVVIETEIGGNPTPNVYPYYMGYYAGPKARLLINHGITSGAITVDENPNLYAAMTGGDVAYGGTVGDLDNDGNLDIVIAADQEGASVILADGSGGYTSLGYEAGISQTNAPIASQNSQSVNERFAEPYLLDFDGDGKPDLLSPSWGYHMLTNTGNWTGQRNSIEVELTGHVLATGASSGKDAFGARVVVTAAGRTMSQEVLPIMGRSRRLHFGLGSTATGTQVSIYWPDNPTTPQVLSGDAYVNKLLRVTEP